MATGSIKSLTTVTESELTHSGQYSTYINVDYSSFVAVCGNLALLRIALEFKPHAATNAWIEVATLPHNSLLNMSQTITTNKGNQSQVRVNGNKFYVNLISAVVAGEVISTEMVYFIET